MVRPSTSPVDPQVQRALDVRDRTGRADFYSLPAPSATGRVCRIYRTSAGYFSDGQLLLLQSSDDSALRDVVGRRGASGVRLAFEGVVQLSAICCGVGRE